MKRIRATGTPVFLHRCEACGADAASGKGVDLRAAFASLDAGDLAGAKEQLGRWYCGEHRPDRADPLRDRGAA